ncbi:alpha/beta hydrolase [Burkholderia multivorans]|uniref:alpha/beta hydrolase n=2 Tax=Burkholderia multivorans TaxID=87883 RepID=UPI000CFF4589|nr:alpha/beta hydrolase [Burkholderia multivorans]MCA8250730.1 alpha/beta hydrolase [Burkholderia multivorans]PRH32882.1 alpha/beta hydrolase [Burkholderia multivorans]
MPLSPDLEAQYNLRALRPDFEAGMLQDWLARSDRFRRSCGGSLDLAYGDGERDRLDYFPAAAADAPLLVFFHGGYWQRGDKSVYSFVAEPFVAAGISVALVNYTLCPAVRVDDIVAQARRALAWLWRHADALGCARTRWIVSGHSAGGHLAARMMATQWPAVGADLPQRLLDGAILISALFDLEPLCETSINDGLRMDRGEARAASALAHPPASDAPQLIAVGGAETAAFHEQAHAYETAFGAARCPMPGYTVEGCDHFDVVQAFADPHHAFFDLARQFVHSASLPVHTASHDGGL